MPAFSQAAMREEVVSFLYRKTGEVEPLRRIFSPWELSDDGASVIGWDHDRDGVRRFSLSNIVGPVEAYDEDYVRPAT